ncbi:unnamed protein product [Nyctereutes procyonoides]|uniref:(raccoon dog) hypothetical protein n=1 Tax=Nyctereutes procyonoides TaxID=34880 RepID=A0A812A0F8_NYCPR|nr:unnamed protein product [Nyctereutes procyonoides]
MFLLPGGEGLARIGEGPRGRGRPPETAPARAEKRKPGRGDEGGRRRGPGPGPSGRPRPDPRELRGAAGPGAGACCSSRACPRTLRRRRRRRRRRPVGPGLGAEGPLPTPLCSRRSVRPPAPPPRLRLPGSSRGGRVTSRPPGSAARGLGAGGGRGAYGEREPVRGRPRSVSLGS